MPAHSPALLETRATLLERIHNLADQSSWREFFDTYWRLIYGVARQAGLTDVEAQDVVQETMVAVVKHIPSFKYDPEIGSFKTWLLNMTRWRIHDQLRKRGPVVQKRPADENGTGTSTVERVIDPNSPDMDQVWEAEWKKTLFDAAVVKVKQRMDPQKYQIFDFYVNKEWAPEKVAKAFGVSVDHVYLAKHRVAEMIRAEVRRLEKETT